MFRQPHIPMSLTVLAAGSLLQLRDLLVAAVLRDVLLPGPWARGTQRWAKTWQL